MATKTWKIGEYSRGGIITAETTAKTATVILKEWDYSKGSRRSSDQSGAKEYNRLTVNLESRSAERQLADFLCEDTTSYYAGQILEWIKTKVKFAQNTW
jgi:hypothetical protein